VARYDAANQKPRARSEKGPVSDTIDVLSFFYSWGLAVTEETEAGATRTRRTGREGIRLLLKDLGTN